MPLEQRHEAVVLPLRSSAAPQSPIAPPSVETKPDEPERALRIAEVPALIRDPRADYFTPGRYAPARPGTPVLKAPAAEIDDRRHDRSLSRAAGLGID